MIAYGSYGHLDPLADRLLLPALPFFGVLTPVAMRACLVRADRLGRGGAALGLVVLLITIVAGASPIAELAARSHAQGAGGLSAREWRESPLVKALLEHPLEGPVYSNLPELVSYYRGVHASFLDPRRLRRGLRESELMHEPGTIIWVSRNGHPRMWARGPPRIELLIQLTDGAIFTARPPSAMDPQSEAR